MAGMIFLLQFRALGPRKAINNAPRTIDDEGFRHAIDAKIYGREAILVDADCLKRVAVPGEEAPRVFGRVFIIYGVERHPCLASSMSCGCSAMQGAHQEAQTFKTLTAPLRNVRMKAQAQAQNRLRP